VKQHLTRAELNEVSDYLCDKFGLDPARTKSITVNPTGVTGVIGIRNTVPGEPQWYEAPFTIDVSRPSAA
jgi:hypothetical protein